MDRSKFEKHLMHMAEEYIKRYGQRPKLRPEVLEILKRH